jgi:hypothetical protein
MLQAKVRKNNDKWSRLATLVACYLQVAMTSCVRLAVVAVLDRKPGIGHQPMSPTQLSRFIGTSALLTPKLL